MGKKIAMVVLLAALITFSVLQNIYVGNATDDLIKKLEEIEQALYTDDEEATITATGEFVALWKKEQNTFEALFEHDEVDIISANSALIASFCQSCDKPHALAEIAAMMHYIKHIQKIDAVRWENIF